MERCLRWAGTRIAFCNLMGWKYCKLRTSMPPTNQIKPRVCWLLDAVNALAHNQLRDNTMQPINQTLSSTSFSDLVPMPVFKIFTVYEDATALARARKVQEQLEVLCNGEVKVLSVSLSFTLFGREQTWENAVAEAATADVIVISASGVDELPRRVKDWTETWPRREQAGQDALVVVFDPERDSYGQQQRLQSYFRQLAEERGLEFFSNHAEWVSSEFPDHLHSGVGAELLAGRDPNRSCYENWGIND